MVLWKRFELEISNKSIQYPSGQADSKKSKNHQYSDSKPARLSKILGSGSFLI